VPGSARPKFDVEPIERRNGMRYLFLNFERRSHAAFLERDSSFLHIDVLLGVFDTGRRPDPPHMGTRACHFGVMITK
jgi:hypothetical protein